MRARLALRFRRGMGHRPGEHRLPRHTDAAGLELEGYRPYAPGDDLRHLDWPALARLDVLLVRRFTAEREVPVHLLVDTSASMGVPVGDAKLASACALAEAVAGIALLSGDPVRVTLLGASAGRPGVWFRHRQALPHLRTVLEAAVPAGAFELGEALLAHARRHPRPSATVVISDCLGRLEPLERGLATLRERRHDVLLIHVVGPAELEPARAFTHGVLEDVESGATHPVRLTPAVAARYGELFRAHLDAVAAVAVRAGVTYARLVAGTSIETFVAADLARAGVVRRR